jgi:metallo-beta-lactamase class B VIM
MTRRLLTILLGLYLLRGAAPVAGAQSVLSLDLDAIELRELAPGVWIHTSYGIYPSGLRVPSNGLVIREGESLLLIDTPWGEVLTATLLARLDRDIQLPVKAALLTHAHGDRLAGADLLRARGIEVWATPLT